MSETTTKATHTAGPWMFRPYPLGGTPRDSNTRKNWPFLIERQGTPGRMDWGILIAQCWGHVSESAEANACLIAAAPGLLSACEEMRAALVAYQTTVDEDPPHKHRQIVERADAAIAKARAV